MELKKNKPIEPVEMNQISLIGEKGAISRRSFVNLSGLGIAALGVMPMACSSGQQKETPKGTGKEIQGFEEFKEVETGSKDWKPVSDRKIERFKIHDV
jgi:hypothetical protein